MTVQDINDTPPRCRHSFYEFNVDEDVRVLGFVIGTLQVYDDDSLGGLSLSFINAPDANLQIRPDGNNGRALKMRTCVSGNPSLLS